MEGFLDQALAFFNAANKFIWGPYFLIPLLLGTGLILTLRLKFMPIRRIPAGFALALKGRTAIARVWKIVSLDGKKWYLTGCLAEKQRSRTHHDRVSYHQGETLMKDSWESGDPYERFMGRWSRLVAEKFVNWLDAPRGLTWIDVGCGSGALSEAIAGRRLGTT